MRYTPDGIPYFVDHNTRTTTFNGMFEKQSFKYFLVESIWEKTLHFEKSDCFFGITKAYSSSSPRPILFTCTFSKYFQILYIFAQIFKYFALFQHLFALFLKKIAPMPFLSRKGPDHRFPKFYWFLARGKTFGFRESLM